MSARLVCWLWCHKWSGWVTSGSLPVLRVCNRCGKHDTVRWQSR